MITESFRAAFNIRKGRSVSLAEAPNSGIEETRIDDVTSMSKIIGIALNDIAPGFSGDVVISGSIEMDGVWDFKNVNESVYVWDYGYLDQKMPPKLLVPVGYALSNDRLFVKIPDFIVRK